MNGAMRRHERDERGRQIEGAGGVRVVDMRGHEKPVCVRSPPRAGRGGPVRPEKDSV